MDEENSYKEERIVQIEPINDEIGKKRKPEKEQGGKETPKAKKIRKAFQQDIRLFVKPDNSLSLNVNLPANNIEKVQK